MIDRDRFRTLSIQQMQQVIATICDHLEGLMPRSFWERIEAIFWSGGEDEKLVEDPWAPEKCLERDELAQFLYNLKPGDRLRIDLPTSPYHGLSCEFVRETYRSHFGAQYVHEWAGVVRFADGEEKEFGPCLEEEVRKHEAILATLYEKLGVLTERERSYYLNANERAMLANVRWDIDRWERIEREAVGKSEAATRLEALAFKVAAAQPKESAEAIKQWAGSLAGDLTAAGEVEYSPEAFPKPDPAIIHAAEGVVLEPGEYEVVAVSILDSMPKLAAGERFEIKERAVATTDGYFRIRASAGGSTWVIAARRVGEDPSQKQKGSAYENQPDAETLVQAAEAIARPEVQAVLAELRAKELRNMGLGESFARPFHSDHRHIKLSMSCGHCHNSSTDYLQSVSEDRLQHYWEHHSKCEEQPVEGAQNKAPNHYDRVVARAEPFPSGTPEAARDALLRASLFDCVVDAGPQTTWHYHYALQIITAYRNELTAENAALRERIETMERENRYHEGVSAEQWFQRCEKANGFRAEAEARVVELEKRCESYKSDAAWWKSGRDQSDREVDALTEKLTTVQRARDEAHVACDRAERLHDREAKPWEAITRWASRPSQLDSSITLTFPFEEEHRFHAELTSGTVLCVSKYGETRQQAFALLAEWCESALKGNGGDNG